MGRRAIEEYLALQNMPDEDDVAFQVVPAPCFMGYAGLSTHRSKTCATA